MNEKYISVLKFKQSLARLTVEGGDKKFAEAIARTLSEVVPKLLDNEPAADVQPVVRAEWVCLEAEIGFYSCSKCEHNVLRATCNYCPNCGAKMIKDGDAE